MTVMRVFPVILVIIATIGCESSKRQAYKSNDYAGSGHLRIRNGSDEDFFDVVFQGNRFGDIKKGQVTEYQLAAQWSTYLEGITVLPGDYPRDEISLRRAGSKDRTRYVWVDYPGRFVSGPYRFTFVLTLQNDYGRESQHLDILRWLNMIRRPNKNGAGNGGERCRFVVASGSAVPDLDVRRSTMLTFAQALELAQTWVRIVTGDECVIVTEQTLKRPYGSVFFCDGRAYLDSGKTSDIVAGNAPILVDRVDGEIRVTGTAQPLEAYLARYESGLPAARMQMSMPKEP